MTFPRAPYAWAIAALLSTLAYAAYLRRFGRLTETADADAAARGDRFPGGGMGRV